MIKTVLSSPVNGTVNAPPSKSVTQRAIAAALLVNGTTVINNPSFCNDSLAAIEMAKRLGGSITMGERELIFKGSGGNLSDVTLNCGESGLAMRLFSPVSMLLSTGCTVTGEGSLRKRPVSMITDALSLLGISARSDNGFLPIHLKGTLKGGRIQIDGSSGSQVLTGLLTALPCVSENSEISVLNLKSKPYIDLTLRILEDFGVRVENQDYSHFIIPGNQAFLATEYSVEGDWSGGAFMLVAGAVTGTVTVKNLFAGSKQADVAILDALRIAGATIVTGTDSIKTVKADLRAFDFDATESPDLFPPLACLAINCRGTSRIRGVSRLEHKESNRAATITGVLKELGINSSVSNDEMLIEGGRVTGSTVSSHNDHRIAMMASVAALTCGTSVTVTGAEAVSKSYPDFFEDLKVIGAIVH